MQERQPPVVGSTPPRQHRVLLQKPSNLLAGPQYSPGRPRKHRTGPSEQVHQRHVSVMHKYDSRPAADTKSTVRMLVVRMIYLHLDLPACNVVFQELPPVSQGIVWVLHSTAMSAMLKIAY